MPEELRRGLAAAAARSGRSLNAELVHRLERSLRRSPLRVVADTAVATVTVLKGRRGRMLRTRYRVVIGAIAIPAALVTALLLAFAGSSRTDEVGQAAPFSKAGAGDPDSLATSPGLGPNSFEAYLSAERTYPANVIPPAIASRAMAEPLHGRRRPGSFSSTRASPISTAGMRRVPRRMARG